MLAVFSDAIAVAGDTLEMPIAMLGPYPIIQFGVVIIIAAVAVIVYVQTRAKDRVHDSGVEVHFDGVLLEHVAALKAIGKLLEELVRMFQSVPLTNSQVADLRVELNERRASMYARIDQFEQTFRVELARSDKEAREQIGDMRDTVHRIDVALARIEGKPIHP